ncbi:SEC-C metal-binding domain-containing protein [Paraliobacillus zengyii]|uniref:YecA/YgfB family protein n=1 Tax=Paraliobacillus zengyii TaxID=2213194 RepID=UPI000E3D8604|nr:SEC-C metal-binding domain-containing protein [Paraliobacillus zengyii]
MEKTKDVSKQLDSKVWKKIDVPSRFSDLLYMLTKQQLDTIRKTLDLKGLSSLNKGELVEELGRLIPLQMEQILHTFDLERYDLIKQISANTGMVVISDDFSYAKIESLLEYGIIFPGLYNDQKVLTMPLELIELFKELDVPELQPVLKRNEEWIKLTHGLLYYYGVLDTAIIEKVEALTNQKIDTSSYFEVINSASDYYQQINSDFYGFSDQRVSDPKQIIKDHQTRSNIDYYPFTKKQLLKAGELNFIDKTPAMERFLKLLQKEYKLNAKQTDDVARQFVNMTNLDASPAQMLSYLQTYITLPSFESVQQMTAEIIEVYNNIRMWMLKGHTSVELKPAEQKQLKPLPTKEEKRSKVVDIRSYKKIGRNEPCPCGSGKKYKKCCL